MASKLDKIKKIISGDKRRCDRLDLPMKVRYAKLSDSCEGEVLWSKSVWLDNIGGEGLGFTSNDAFLEGEKIDIELMLPQEDEPVYLGAKVMWISENADSNRGVHPGRFSYGLQIYWLKEDDRKKFEQFIADNIIERYLDDQGKLRDI